MCYKLFQSFEKRLIFSDSTQNMGKLLPKIEEITGGKAHVNAWKLNQNISTGTAVFINQKRANFCEDMTKIIREFMKGATRGLREELMEGKF